MSIGMTLLVAMPAAFAMQGEELLRLCAPKASPEQQATCVAYIEGVAEGYAGGHYSLAAALFNELGSGASFQVVANAERELSACMPLEVAPQQLQDVTFAYLNGHPDVLKRSATVSVVSALRAAFPCK
ncbi:Rap1a/Tai family immunity protein [Ralstonia pickettii]|uniref:Rap1a/Tai family immunity protein n=1 Tax=Ralstonia pickettii TaxID=329 RepID=UPI0015BCF1FA|nr:hypothetical protein [Ralstonia pickettii]